jgi:hypothetical protein
MIKTTSCGAFLKLIKFLLLSPGEWASFNYFSPLPLMIFFCYSIMDTSVVGKFNLSIPLPRVPLFLRDLCVRESLERTMLWGRRNEKSQWLVFHGKYIVKICILCASCNNVALLLGWKSNELYFC